MEEHGLAKFLHAVHADEVVYGKKFWFRFQPVSAKNLVSISALPKLGLWNVVLCWANLVCPRAAGLGLE